MTKTKQLPIILLALSLSFSASASTTNSSVPAFTIIETSESHMAKALYYRWFQLYERPMNEIRISNQLQILTDNVIVSSNAGTMVGKANYPARVEVYKGWTNAHHVENVNVKKLVGGMLQLTATVNYQNMTPDGSKSSYTLNYKTMLTNTEQPQFSKIEITPTGKSDLPLIDAYPANRMRSLVHYWLANMETQSGSIKPFKDVLTKDYQLNFSSKNNIHTDEQFSQWLQGTASQVETSNHYVRNFTATSIGANTYEVLVDFDWQGVLKNGTKMKAKTHHKWTVVDNPNEPFARIQRMDVTAVEPFSIVQ